MTSTRKMQNKLSSAEHMPWVKGRKGYLFQSKPLEIDAPSDLVWDLVNDPNHYYEQLSHDHHYFYDDHRHGYFHNYCAQDSHNQLQFC